MNFTEEYAKRKDEFENYLHGFANEFLNYPKQLGDAVLYALTSGGKRLRPILFLETLRMFGGKVNAAAVNFALAIECIHTYSLIHDDLPCMDNDDLRRGKPTCHKKFGEANALLAGDALLNLAYELMLCAMAIGNKPENCLKAAACIASAAGGNGMVGGQTCDLSDSVTKESIDYIYSHKTGALIKAAVRAGAIMGGADESDLKRMDIFGENFGYCFQLKDDLLDKDTESAEKKTYLNLYGEDKTAAKLKEKTVEALKILQEIDTSEFLTELTANFMERME